MSTTDPCSRCEGPMPNPHEDVTGELICDDCLAHDIDAMKDSEKFWQEFNKEEEETEEDGQ